MFRTFKAGLTGAVITGAILAVVAAANTVQAASPSAIAANPQVGEVVSGFRDTQALTGTAPRTVGMDLQPGSYNITAKLYAFNNNSEKITITCRLQLGGAFDDSVVMMQLNSEAAPMAMNVANNVSVLTSVSLRCQTNSTQADVQLKFIKVTASRVGFAYVNSLIG